MKQIKKLSKEHIQIIEHWIANPSLNQKDLAAEFGKNPSWMCCVVNSQVFKEEFDRRLKEHWRWATKIAQKTMIDLAEGGDRQAAAYILDSAGYAPKQQIEIENRQIVVSIDD